MIWYYLVHDNFFVSGLDWGTIILYLYESDTGLGWVVGSWKKNVDHHMMNTIWKEGFKSGILFPNSYQEFKEAWEDGSYEIDGCRYYNENEFDVVQEGWEENMEDF